MLSGITFITVMLLRERVTFVIALDSDFAHPRNKLQTCRCDPCGTRVPRPEQRGMSDG